jgi:hypothetical protein
LPFPERHPATRRAPPGRRDDDRARALRQSLRTFAWTRLLVAVTAVGAAAWLTPSTNTDYGPRWFGRWPLGGLLDRVFNPLVHWDAKWYLTIADHGYGAGAHVGHQAAFFPLYPLTARVVSSPIDPSRGALVIASQFVSLACFLVALYLFHRLVELELGRSFAVPAVTLLAVFPASFYFSAPYTESMFLLFSIGAFYAARRERWAWAGVLAAGASGTRLVGLLVVGALVLLYLYGPRGERPSGPPMGRLRPRYRPRRNFLWLALGLLGPVLYSAFLGARYGNGLAWAQLEKSVWNRHLANPLKTVWDGGVAALNGLDHLLTGTGGHAAARYALVRGHEEVAVIQFAVLVVAVVAIAAVVRRLPLAYGAYCVAALLVVLSSEATDEPLASLIRYVMVLFPILMWLAVVCVQRKITNRVVAISTVLLVLFTAGFASGRLPLA